jgi:formylglycine-generating enzyme required for sulfatase activity
MKMVFIPKGTFMMGSPPSEEGRNDDEVQHEVTITRDFYLGAYEVTQSQYERVMGHNPSKFQGAVVDHVNEDLPVDFVGWQDAVEFCARLTAMDQENISGKVYRLPTEAEWEYACRAGTTSVYWFGDEIALLPECAWFDFNSRNRTHTVGLKEPSPWGLYDMYGNVWEWCWDFGWTYAKTAVKDPAGPASGDTHVLRGGSWRGEYPERPLVDPRGADLGTRRVTRGGSFLFGFEDLCRSASRTGMKATFRSIDVGFRIVLEMRPD